MNKLLDLAVNKEWLSGWGSIPNTRSPHQVWDNQRALRKTVYRDLLTWGRKQYRLVTGLLTGRCNLRWHLRITGLLDNATCRKCGQKEESSYHILCQCPALAGHTMKIFSSAVAEATDISRAPFKQVLALMSMIGLFWRTSASISDLSAWGDPRLSPMSILYTWPSCKITISSNEEKVRKLNMASPFVLYQLQASA